MDIIIAPPSVIDSIAACFAMIPFVILASVIIGRYRD